jgi:hypothetical protein
LDIGKHFHRQPYDAGYPGAVFSKQSLSSELRLYTFDVKVGESEVQTIPEMPLRDFLFVLLQST